MIKVVAAFFLLLGSGLIFRALVAMDAPIPRLRPLARRPTRSVMADSEVVTLRRAA